MKNGRVSDFMYYGITCVLLIAVGVVIGIGESRNLEDLSNTSSVISMLIALWASVYAVRTFQSWKKPLSVELLFEVINASNVLSSTALNLHISLQNLFIDSVPEHFLNRKVVLISLIEEITNKIHTFNNTRLSALAGRDSPYVVVQRLTHRLGLPLLSLQHLLDNLNVADRKQLDPEESNTLNETARLCLALSQEVDRFNEVRKDQLFTLLSNGD